MAEYSDGSKNLPASGTFIASSNGDCVVPLQGTYAYESPGSAEFRNPNLISGVEFSDASGAKSNQFQLFKFDKSLGVPKGDNFIIENTLIKCKTDVGLPRIRFDLSSYGNRRNYFIKDHKFRLRINSLIAEENSNKLGGGKVGVWIHTQPIEGYFWSWVNNTWVPNKETDLSVDLVLQLAQTYSHPNSQIPKKCLINNIQSSQNINNLSLKDIKKSYFQDAFFEFDTRNFTKFNNYEYLKVLPVEEKYYKIVEKIHKEDTNYIVEIFFIPNINKDKYLLINEIGLQDITQRERAAIGTGFGVETSGIPNRRFVKENKLYLDKEQLSDVLKFYNGLAGNGAGIYATSLASRDATITSETLEVSGGSRLNYRVHPDWGVTTTTGGFNYTKVEFDN